jgi:hypothetical protein
LDDIAALQSEDDDRELEVFGSSGSNPVLATTSADRQLIPRLRTEHCSAEVVSSVPGSEVPGDYRIGSPELHRIFAGDLRCRVTGLPLRMAAAARRLWSPGVVLDNGLG